VTMDRDEDVRVAVVTAVGVVDRAAGIDHPALDMRRGRRGPPRDHRLAACGGQSCIFMGHRHDRRRRSTKRRVLDRHFLEKSQLGPRSEPQTIDAIELHRRHQGFGSLFGPMGLDELEDDAEQDHHENDRRVPQIPDDGRNARREEQDCHERTGEATQHQNQSPRPSDWSKRAHDRIRQPENFESSRRPADTQRSCRVK